MSVINAVVKNLDRLLPGFTGYLKPFPVADKPARSWLTRLKERLKRGSNASLHSIQAAFNNGVNSRQVTRALRRTFRSDARHLRLLQQSGEAKQDIAQDLHDIGVKDADAVALSLMNRTARRAHMARVLASNKVTAGPTYGAMLKGRFDDKRKAALWPPSYTK